MSDEQESTAGDTGVDVTGDTGEDVTEETFDSAAYTIDELKAEVEKNPQLAREALAGEQARGDAARVTLVAWLEESVSQLPTVDPSELTVEQVKDHVEKHPEEAEAILAAEEAGKGRKGVLEEIEVPELIHYADEVSTTLCGVSRGRDGSKALGTVATSAVTCPECLEQLPAYAR